MASTISFKCSFFCLLFVSYQFIISSSQPITLNLSPVPKPHASENPTDIISDVAKSTLQRAYNLKHHNNQHPSSSAPSDPLFAHGSPGRYSVSLSIGTPPQRIPTLFDTGSSLVWVPCTSHYTCANCTQSSSSTTITVFKPKRSSSKQTVNCNNRKCRWLDQPGLTASCPSCKRCKTPCSYIEAYGSGLTLGRAITENLNLQGKVVRGLFVGCSSFSQAMPEGIVGFGRSPMSVPSQLKLDKFSYCLISHNYDDTSKSSRLVLGDSRVAGVRYTPLLKNPPMLPFNQYYYVLLEEISVGKKFVRMPSEAHVPDSKGNGGCIVDSGSTLTSLPSSLFTLVVNEFVAQMLPNKRKLVTFAPTNLGNILCVNVKGQREISFPDVGFHFKGGVKMDLPAASYFSDGGNLLCLPFVNVTFAVGVSGSGPAVIVGNYQQQNFHIEYDLKNERLGLKKQNCG